MNGWKGKKCGMVRGSKDFPEKQDPGVGWEGGDNITVIGFFQRGGKGQKPKPKTEWHFYYHHYSGFLVLNSQLYPQPPTQETRKIKEKETPFPIPNQLTKQVPSPRSTGFGERPFLLSPMHLSMEPNSKAQPHS